MTLYEFLEALCLCELQGGDFDKVIAWAVEDGSIWPDIAATAARIMW